MSDPLPQPQGVFLDTNVLVYCADRNDPEKQRINRHHLHALRKSNRAFISTQILQEFYAVTTGKLGMLPEISHRYISQYRQLPTVTITPDLIDQAIVLHQTQQISFWDALIVSAAVSAGCRTLLTEDLNAGQIIAGVEIVRPEEGRFD